MTDKFRICDIVKVKSSGKVGVLIEVQYKHDRYHIRGLSGWQYGIDDLEKVEIDSLISTIESQKEEIARHQEREFNHYPIMIYELENRAMAAEKSLNITVEALEHICEVDMDSAEFERELMFNVARDALNLLPQAPETTESA